MAAAAAHIRSRLRRLAGGPELAEADGRTREWGPYLWDSRNEYGSGNREERGVRSGRTREDG